MKKFNFTFLILLTMLTAWAVDDKIVVKTVLYPYRETIIASRIDSVLLPYQVRIGERFEKGDMLVYLDDTGFSIEAKRTAEQYDFAKVTYEDKARLHEQKFVSDYEMRRAEFDYKIAETNLAEAKLRLSFCKVNAPFSGKIVEILTKEYETVRLGQPLFRIIDDNQLLAVMNVPINNTYLTTVGNNVSIKITERDLVANGLIYEVTPQADHRTGTVRIRVMVDNVDAKFTAGMTGELIYGK